MSIHPDHLRNYVIRPALKFMCHYSESAEELLMLTAAAESRLGHYLHQINGPALGIYQMEPRTHNDIHLNWLRYKAIRDSVLHFGSDVDDLAGNLYYATVMTRCHYLRVPEALPEPDDVEGLALYWKDHYNTHLGSGTPVEAMELYYDLVVNHDD